MFLHVKIKKVKFIKNLPNFAKLVYLFVLFVLIIILFLFLRGEGGPVRMVVGFKLPMQSVVITCKL
jgi:hypothetical protein